MKKMNLLSRACRTIAAFTLMIALGGCNTPMAPDFSEMSATTFNSNTSKSNEYALFVVNKNQSTPRPFSSIEGLDGNLYSIPSENNGYSPLAIKLLSQFMSLQKIPGSIPASPSVLLK